VKARLWKLGARSRNKARLGTLEGPYKLFLSAASRGTTGVKHRAKKDWPRACDEQALLDF
jgi:hypothetical protein